ncbi:MAG: RsiV family protein [Clostridiales bacterium]|nr:RsiV family protein [Clostridiales bacterium]
MGKSGIQKGKNSSRKILLHGLEIAAAVCVIFMLGLNSNPVFAKEAGNLPVIGGLARVLTFRSYETEQDEIAVSVEIPSIEMIAKDTGIPVDAINQEILDCCNRYAENALEIAEDYRKAFLETGGTPEEWAEHNIRITVDYEIKQQNDDYLSFVVRGTQNWANAYNETIYYNLDLNTGKYVTLKDMLGENYVELANESIKEQIRERQNNGEIFFTEEEGGFAGIEEEPKFYINHNNLPVIVFEQYEIAPGSSGEIEFEISREKPVLQDTNEPEKAGENAEENTEENTEEIKHEASAAFYEDNFAVDDDAAKAFAEKIKVVVAERDLEGLASLTSFPVYVGLPGVSVVENQEAFLELGADTVFTDRLVESVEKADIDHFAPCMAGFSVSDGAGANINFGVVDGVLAVNGINY